MGKVPALQESKEKKRNKTVQDLRHIKIFHQEANFKKKEKKQLS
jgi:hypothetical protein